MQGALPKAACGVLPGTLLINSLPVPGVARGGTFRSKIPGALRGPKAARHCSPSGRRPALIRLRRPHGAMAEIAGELLPHRLHGYAACGQGMGGLTVVG